MPQQEGDEEPELNDASIRAQLRTSREAGRRAAGPTSRYRARLRSLRWLCVHILLGCVDAWLEL